MRSWARMPATGTPTAGTVEHTLGGNVASGGTPVEGALIELCNASGVVLDTELSDASGDYDFGSKTDGDYVLNCQAPHNYSLDAAEDGATSGLRADGYAFTLSGTHTKNFELDAAWFSDNFASYADTAAMISSTGFGGSARGLNLNVSNWFEPANTSNSLNATGGPNGGKCYQHDITSSSFPGGTIGPFGAWNNGTTFSTLYMRVIDWYSSAWDFSIEYKQWINSMVNDANNSNAQGPHFFVTSSGSSPQITYEQSDESPGHFITSFSSGTAYCTYPSVGTSCKVNFTARNTWNCWVYEITNIGQSNHTITVYLNGERKSSITGDMTNLVAPGKLRTGQPLGANYNNGTYAAQSRRVAEVGVYATRPAMVSLF